MDTRIEQGKTTAKTDGEKVCLPVWSSLQRLDELRRYQFAMTTKTPVLCRNRPV